VHSIDQRHGDETGRASALEVAAAGDTLEGVANKLSSLGVRLGVSATVEGAQDCIQNV
jgi:hypothetical protein